MKSTITLAIFIVSVLTIRLAIRGTSVKKFKAMGVMYYGHIISAWITGLLGLFASVCLYFKLFGF